MKFSRLKHQLIEPLCQCFIVLLCIIMEDQKQMFKDLHLAFFLIVVIDHKILRKMIYRTSQEGCICGLNGAT